MSYVLAILAYLHPLAVRFFESSRIRWISSIGEEVGGQAQADAFLRARGVSFILKSIEVNFRKPVQYPDTVSLAHLRPSGISDGLVGLAIDRP